MQFNQISSPQVSTGGVADPRTYIRDPSKRPTGLEFIRTVRIADHTRSWSFSRVDIDVPEANFVRYKEILYSFNGGFSSSNNVELNCYPRKYGSLFPTTIYYNSQAATSTSAIAWVNTSTTGVVPIAPATTGVTGTTSFMKQVDIYMSQLGFRAEVYPGDSQAVLPTGSLFRTTAAYTYQTGEGSQYLPGYLETDYTGITLYHGNGTTQTMVNPYLFNNGYFECNIYGYIR